MNPSPSFLSDPTVIHRENLTLGITQSEMTTWDDCSEKWYRGYNQMLRKKNSYALYFVVGTAMHTTLQNFYNGNFEVARLQFPEGTILTNEEEGVAEKAQRMVDIQMRRYATYYEDDLRVFDIQVNEEVVEVEFEGVKLAGRLDLGYVNRFAKGKEKDLVFMDHKSMSRFDMNVYEGWQFRFQFMFYLWLYEKRYGIRPSAFVVNAIKKPGQKQGKTESVDSLLARIKADMDQTPGDYFKRIPLPTIKGSMKHFEERVLRPKLERIHLLTQASTPANIIESLTRNQNTNNCVKFGKSCEFLPICTYGYAAESHQYTRRETKHEELEAE